MSNRQFDTVRSELIILDSPPLDLLPGIFQRHEPVRVQAFVPEAAVETLDVRVIRRRSRSRVFQFHFVEISPGIQRP